MKKRSHKLNILFAISIVFILSCSTVLTTALAQSTSIHIQGFEKGVSWKPVVPIKKVTFINYDEESYLDDYAYLAAVPSSVFYDEDALYSHPLLFFEEDIEPDKDKELPLNAGKGVNYFMEDWMSYCNGELDEMTLVNVPRSQIDDSWDAREYSFIEGENPFEVAGEIALQDWSFSKDAVVAVIDEDFEKPGLEVSNRLEGTIPSRDIYEEPAFEVEQTNSLNPVYHDFTVGEGYKYIKAEAWWDSIAIMGMWAPAGDPDIQLYCRHLGDWMQVTSAAFWNLFMPKGREYTQSYVYKPGSWKIGITDFPTESDAPQTSGPLGLFTVQGSLLKALSKSVTYHVDITLYPGVEFVIPDVPPFGCRDVDFELTWDNPNMNLGFTILGPSGEAIFTMINESRTDTQETHFELLGECLPGESYSVAVFSLNDVLSPLDFEFEYSWTQNVSKAEANSLTSATEGAVLASILNAPLLYTKPTILPSKTKDALYKLGVENIYLVNLGDHLSNDVKMEIENIGKIKENYKEHKEIYDAITDTTGRNDIVFTTINPWTYWLLGELEPAGEKEKSLFIGPAAFIAAHHGTPVIIVDNHPRLSSAVVWHNEFWKRFADDRYMSHPSVAEMVLTGNRIYEFLDIYGFDKEGLETIITVADQYDIGMPWDRVFPGVANSGRFCGSPVDTSYWISRNVFYPAMIYANPALQGEVSLINGSISDRMGVRGMIRYPYVNSLAILRGSGQEDFQYPVLCSFVCHKYRFNERASEYYGSQYQCADGYTPGMDNTLEPIDQGSIEKHTGKEGAYFPDMSESEVVPFYLKRGGYSAAFSTSLPAVTHNLNQGVILWMHGSHGSEPNGGQTLFWDPANGFEIQAKEKNKLVAAIALRLSGAMKEENPWRGYDWYLGSTEQPDAMSMDIMGILPYTNIRFPFLPALGDSLAVARKPLRELLNQIIPIIDPFRDNLHDGIIGSSGPAVYPMVRYNATAIEANLDNLHSAGFITSICQTSNTYFHLMLIRHGTVFQVQDPWPTSWYGSVWRQSIPRDIALGYTIGEAYTRGISHVGSLYVTDPPQWWWDDAENVVYFGDPDLRVFVPSTEYSNNNNWKKPETLRYDTETTINGHMPFGSTSHTHIKTPSTIWQQYLPLIVGLVLIIILLVAARLMGRKRKR